MKNIFKAACLRRQGKIIDKVFEIGVLIKALFGFFEISAGILFTFLGQRIMDNFIIDLALQEIADDPNDFLANYLINMANEFSIGSQVFAAAYLIFHGLANLLLVIALFKNKIEAYRWAIVIFSVFIIYQLYKYFHNYSLLLLLLTIFDIFIVSVIWLEYRRKKNKLGV